MDTLWDIKIQLVFFLQNLGEWLRGPMQGFTFLGEQEFFILIIPALYLCINPAAGMRFALFLVMTGSISEYFKFLFHAPRPFWVSQQVQAMAVETSFGLPSGHAQNAVVVFGSLTRSFRQRWLGWIIFGLAFLIGISRLYLGMHFPSDVLVGWLIGYILLRLAFKLEGPFLVWFKRKQGTMQIVLVFLGSVGIIAIGWLLRLAFSNWEIPSEWAANAAAALPPDEPFNPFSLEVFVSAGGLFLGLAAGAILLASRGGFNAQGSLVQLAARYLLGVAGLLVLYRGLDLIFPEGESLVAFIFRYVRYAAMGFWLFALAPLIFRRIGLAK